MKKQSTLTLQVGDVKKSAKIKSVLARQIVDSRGYPTIEVEITTESGISSCASVPSGASTGEREALELRDGDKRRFHGKGVQKAVNNVNKIIAPEICGLDVRSQQMIDYKLINMDGTPNKSKFGANAILGVSMASAKAAAMHSGLRLFEYLGKGVTLPCPFVNVINGGAHADNNLDFQEFMLVPSCVKTFSEALRACCEIFLTLKGLLKEKGYVTAVGDEGGFAPRVRSFEEALDLLIKSITKSGYKAGKDVSIALDVAASEFYEDGKYVFKKSDRSSRTSSDMIKLYTKLISDYPIISIEDGLSENDWNGWKELTQQLGKKVQLVGDDLFVTNPIILRKGIESKTANAILIKLNQIGTVTETIEAIKTAQKAGYNTMISHRSGETEDTTIADLAVAFDTGMIKTGSVTRGERTCKYNELLRIEEYLGSKAKYGTGKLF